MHYVMFGNKLNELYIVKRLVNKSKNSYIYKVNIQLFLLLPH